MDNNIIFKSKLIISLIDCMVKSDSLEDVYSIYGMISKNLDELFDMVKENCKE